MRVMLVEDHAVFRTALRELFVTEGSVVRSGGRGGDGAGRLAARRAASARRHDHGSVPARRERHLRHARAVPAAPRHAHSHPDGGRQSLLRPRSVRGGRARLRAEGADGGRDHVGGARGRRWHALPAAAIRSGADVGPEVGRATRRAVRQLSAREREIFDLVVAGHANQRIAAELFISIKTVETHRARINRKLGVHSGVELVRFAALHGRL